MVGLILYGRKLNRLPVRAEDVHLAGPGLTEDLGGPDVLAGAGFIPLRAVEGGCIQRNNSEALSLVALPIGDIENRSGLQSHPNQPAAGRGRAGKAIHKSDFLSQERLFCFDCSGSRTNLNS